MVALITIKVCPSRHFHACPDSAVVTAEVTHKQLYGAGITESHYHAGREAVAAARSLAEEQANVSMYAFGVGSGVDRYSSTNSCIHHNGRKAN